MHHRIQHARTSLHHITPRTRALVHAHTLPASTHTPTAEHAHAHTERNCLRRTSHVEASLERTAAEDGCLWHAVSAECKLKALVFRGGSSRDHSNCCTAAGGVCKGCEVEWLCERAVRVAEPWCRKGWDDLVGAREYTAAKIQKKG